MNLPSRNRHARKRALRGRRSAARSRARRPASAMAPDPRRPHIWTPRNTTRSFPKRVSPPKTRKYDAEAHRKPPTLVMKRTITSLDQDPEAAAMLLKRIPEWRAEADRLEAQLANLTLPERLATLMFKVDVPLKIKEQEKEWDPNGGGTITLGEFRQHIRGVGLEASNEDIDALFQQVCALHIQQRVSRTAPRLRPDDGREPSVPTHCHTHTAPPRPPSTCAYHSPPRTFPHAPVRSRAHTLSGTRTGVAPSI